MIRTGGGGQAATRRAIVRAAAAIAKHANNNRNLGGFMYYPPTRVTKVVTEKPALIEVGMSVAHAYYLCRLLSACVSRLALQESGLESVRQQLLKDLEEAEVDTGITDNWVGAVTHCNTRETPRQVLDRLEELDAQA